MSKANPVIVHYLIIDSGDGSAFLKFFKTPKARDEYADVTEDRGNSVVGEGTLRQNDLDEALSLVEVRAEATELEADPLEDSDSRLGALWPFPTGNRR